MAATSLYSQLVTVVIPLYRNLLNDIERWAVERNLRVLAPERDIAVVCPHGLDLSPLEGLLGIETGRCRVERFDSQFFDGRRGYNRFMLNSELYSRFSESKFIAVCQTDVALFHDNLDYWCSLDYDYIGAPWLPARNEIEGHPKMAMRLTGGKLPMGTHAFYRRRNRAFWSNYLDFNI